MSVLQASEPTTASRSSAPSSPARDKRPAGSGFSSLVDDNATAKAASSRPEKPNADPVPTTETPRSRDVPSNDTRAPRDADRKATDDAARAADARGPRKSTNPADDAEQVSSDTPEAVKTKTVEPTSADAATADNAPTPPAPLPLDPSAAIISTPTDVVQPTATATPAALTAPVAIQIPISAPVQTPVPAQAQTPAPLAIAAAGLAAAKAVTAKTSDDVATTTGAPATGTPAAAATAEPSAEAIVPSLPDVATPKDTAAAKPATAELKLPTGFTAPDAAAKTDAPVQTAAAAKPDTAPETKIDAKIETKPETKPEQPVEAKSAAPVLAEASKAASSGKAADLQPAQPLVATADSAGPAPQITVPQPSHHTISAPSPAAQLTAAVATAQPVPLNGLAVELAARASGGATRFEMRLDPAELGRIDVRIDIDKHGQVTSHLTVEKPETLALLRQDSPQLQRALNDAGFKTADGAMQFSLGDQSQSQAQQQNTDNGQRQAHRLFIQDDEASAPLVPIRDYGRLAAARSGVDISV